MLKALFLFAARMILRLVPSSSRVGRLVMWPLAHKALGSSFEATVELKSGGCLLGTMHDSLTRSILLYGPRVEAPWEPATTRVIRSIAPIIRTALFGGAHVGWHVIGLARRMPPGGLVLAFEPNPEMYRVLHRNVQMNQLPVEIKLEKTALGDKHGDTPMWMSNIRSSLLPPPDHESAAEMVAITTIDQVMMSRSLDPIDLVVLDVEGYEWEVFQGAGASLFSQAELPLLIFEVIPGTSAANDPIRSFLGRLQYESFAILGDEQELAQSSIVALRKWSRQMERRLSDLRNYNILSIPPTRAPRLRRILHDARIATLN